MAWVTIKRKKYYYHSIRVGDVVFTLYCGRGPRAEMMERFFADHRETMKRLKSAIKEQDRELRRLHNLRRDKPSADGPNG